MYSFFINFYQSFKLAYVYLPCLYCCGKRAQICFPLSVIFINKILALENDLRYWRIKLKKKNPELNFFSPHIFAFETMGPWSAETKKLVNEMGEKLPALSGDIRSTSYLK
uniref:Uncharacterized protein n=1 Tax=Cacopsylla melanoneura TaxID=428564 RepID=A0A8D8PS48_9HEMI